MSENNDAWDDWETAADAGLADFNKPVPTRPKQQDTDEMNAKLWHQANEYATPTIIRTDTVRTQYQPEIKILKRSQDASQRRPDTPGGTAPVKTMKEREKEYMLARQRIFGKEDGSK